MQRIYVFYPLKSLLPFKEYHRLYSKTDCWSSTSTHYYRESTVLGWLVGLLWPILKIVDSDSTLKCLQGPPKLSPSNYRGGIFSQGEP